MEFVSSVLGRQFLVHAVALDYEVLLCTGCDATTELMHALIEDASVGFEEVGVDVHVAWQGWPLVFDTASDCQRTKGCDGRRPACKDQLLAQAASFLLCSDSRATWPNLEARWSTEVTEAACNSEQYGQQT